MEKGMYDQVVDELLRRDQLFRQEIQRRNKGKKPFRMEPVSDDEQLYIYENMTSAALGDSPDANDPSYVGDLEYAIETYGEEAVNDWMFDMEQIKKRRKL